MTIAQISLDPTLTVENVTDVMEKVTVDKRRQVWKKVIKYGTSFSSAGVHVVSLSRPEKREIVDEIYSSHSSEEEKTHIFSDMYVNCRPESSWKHLTTLLYEEDEMTAVDQARSFLPPRGKLTTNKQCLMFVVAWD